MKTKIFFLTFFIVFSIKMIYSQVNERARIGLGISAPLTFGATVFDLKYIPSLTLMAGFETELILSKPKSINIGVNYLKTSLPYKYWVDSTLFIENDSSYMIYPNKYYYEKLNYHSLTIPIYLKSYKYKKLNLGCGIINSIIFISKTEQNKTNFKLSSYQFGVLYQLRYQISEKINISTEINLNLSPLLRINNIIFKSSTYNLNTFISFNYLLFSSKK